MCILDVEEHLQVDFKSFMGWWILASVFRGLMFTLCIVCVCVFVCLAFCCSCPVYSWSLVESQLLQWKLHVAVGFWWKNFQTIHHAGHNNSTDQLVPITSASSSKRPSILSILSSWIWRRYKSWRSKVFYKTTTTTTTTTTTLFFAQKTVEGFFQKLTSTPRLSAV